MIRRVISVKIVIGTYLLSLWHYMDSIRENLAFFL